MSHHHPRAAVFGAGFIGAIHLQSLRRLGIEVVAIAGSSAASVKRHAAAHGVPAGYADYRQLLNHEDVDVVHICAPPALHCSMADAALRSGRHVVCEKPLTLDPREARDLVALTERTKRVAAVNFNIRYYSAVQQARAMVAAGELGAVQLIHGSYLQDFHVPETPWGWRFEPTLGGTMRAISEIGSHWLDLVRYVTGLEVASLVADTGTYYPWRRKPVGRGKTHRTKIISEDCAGVLLRYTSGAAGTLTLSEISPGRKNQLRLEIVGSKASLAWDSERLQELWIGHKDQPNEVMVSGFSDGFVDTFERLHREVYERVRSPSAKSPPPFPTFADGHEIVRLCQAIVESARDGAWTEIARNEHP